MAFQGNCVCCSRAAMRSSPGWILAIEARQDSIQTQATQAALTCEEVRWMRQRGGALQERLAMPIWAAWLGSGRAVTRLTIVERGIHDHQLLVVLLRYLSLLSTTTAFVLWLLLFVLLLSPSRNLTCRQYSVHKVEIQPHFWC
jgi:hypothetical protein